MRGKYTHNRPVYRWGATHLHPYINPCVCKRRTSFGLPGHNGNVSSGWDRVVSFLALNSLGTFCSENWILSAPNSSMGHGRFWGNTVAEAQMMRTGWGREASWRKELPSNQAGVDMQVWTIGRFAPLTLWREVTLSKIMTEDSDEDGAGEHTAAAAYGKCRPTQVGVNLA